MNSSSLFGDLFLNVSFSFGRDVFQGLNELESLDLEHNQLNYLDSEAFGPLEQLKHARLSHNLLSFKNEENYPQGGLPYTDIIGNQSPFRHCFKLEYLYLANNSIKDIFDDWRINLLQIRVLDLSHNKIQHLIVSINLLNTEHEFYGQEYFRFYESQESKVARKLI